LPCIQISAITRKSGMINKTPSNCQIKMWMESVSIYCIFQIKFQRFLNLLRRDYVIAEF